MTAEILTGKPPGGDRVILADVLPLDTPLVVQIFPIYACNMTCSFCHFSIPKDQREFVTTRAVMDFSLYRSWIDDMTEFHSKIRVLRFVGMGEPLLHPDIVEMVRYATKSKVAEKTEIVTNGTKLSRDMADGLAGAGLSRIVVSVQDTSLARRVEYLHSLKKVHVYVKIIDCCLKGPEDEQRFYDTFRYICDSMAVEHAGPIYRGATDNEKLSTGKRTQYNRPSQTVTVCPQPFTTMQINPDGKVVPCYSIEYPCFVGNANFDKVPQIWFGWRMREFRQKMLNGRMGASDNCAVCKIIEHRMAPEDCIDGAVERLKGVYG